MTAAALAPAPPRGCVERRPMGPSEVVRWEWCHPSGDVTVVLMAYEGRRAVRVTTGPGTCSPTIGHAGLAWELAMVLAAAADWMAGDPPPAPERLDQPSLFDLEVSA